jgi:galactokinase
VPDEPRIARTLAALDVLGAAPAGPPSALYVPGRIEVLGKHTDYAGGRSLLVASRQGLCVCFRARDDGLLRVVDATRGLEAEIEIACEMPAVGGWRNYLVTVARRLAANFPARDGSSLRGADVAFTSDLPRAAGMSSSSALVVATYLVLAAVNALADRREHRRAIASPEQLGEYLGCVENGLDFGSLAGEAGVGTFGGSEDQTAILCSRRGELRQYSYSPIRHERTLVMPPGLVFAVADSGVSAEKTGAARAAYNRASRLASGIAEAWREATGRDEPHAAAILALGSGARRRLDSILAGWSSEEFSGEELARRFEHFATESEEIVPEAGAALAAGDLDRFGALVDRSQRGAERLLDNQIPETRSLARAARELGARAASAFGAGFGGSVWALVERERAEPFLDSWRGCYLGEFPRRAGARFLVTEAADGARPLEVGSAGGGTSAAR